MAVIVTFILTKRRDIVIVTISCFWKNVINSNWLFKLAFPGKNHVQDKIMNLVYFFPSDKLQLFRGIIKAIKQAKPREVKLLRAI